MDQYRRGKGLPEVKRADYEAQVRKCGRLMMREVTSAYPGITMLMIPDTGWKGHRDYDLLPAFVDGILEGAGPRVTLVDGCEDGYSAQTYGEFLSIRQDAAKAGPAISNLASVYRKRMRYGFGLWLDYSPDKYGGWHTAVGDLDKNYRSPDRMEHAVYNALSAADKGSYVWLYVSHPDYWWQPSSRGKPSPIHPHQCVLCPHSGMPKEYLGALAKVRAPHDLSWTSPVSLMGKQYRAEQLAVMGPNLLGNSGFEAWSAGAGSPPDGWTGGATERIGEATGAHSGSFAVQLSKRDESHMFIEQRIPGGQYASKTVILGVWCKLTADSAGSLSILSKVGDKYVVEGNDAECPADGQWHFIVARQTIPAGAETVYLRLNAYSLEAYAPVDFDDAVAVVEK